MELEKQWQTNGDNLKNMTITSEIKQIRKQKGVTTYDLSELTGIDQGAISRIENGKANPTLKTLEKICKALKIKLKLIC